MSRLPHGLSLQAARSRVPRRGAGVFLLLAWVFLSQTLLIVHRIDHAKKPEGVTCTLCVAADHQAAAVAEAAHAIHAPDTAFVASSISGAPRAPSLLSYRSRAPPARLHA
jgi:hypothetical protein